MSMELKIPHKELARKRGIESKQNRMRFKNLIHWYTACAEISDTQHLFKYIINARKSLSFILWMEYCSII